MIHDNPSQVGCFVDIRQQDGRKVRMFYPLKDLDFVKWVGAMEMTAEKFSPNEIQP